MKKYFYEQYNVKLSNYITDEQLLERYKELESLHMFFNDIGPDNSVEMSIIIKELRKRKLQKINKTI